MEHPRKLSHLKRRKSMKVAIPVLQDLDMDSPISEHFGHAPYFAFVEVANGKVSAIEIIQNPYMEHSPRTIPQFISEKGTNVLIVRGIGRRALEHFSRLGIQVIRGASGTVKEILEAFTAGKLSDTPYQVKEKFHEQ